MHRFLPGKRHLKLPLSISAGAFMSTSERIRIARAFHRQAGVYDQHALVQKRIVAHLDKLVAAHLEEAPAEVLDIGCGTGAMLGSLHQRYPQTRLCGLDLAFNMVQRSANQLGDRAILVNGAAEQLPFGDRVFDLVVSASTLQWVERVDICFEESRRVLKKGGLLCVAFFGGRTLWELQECYREAVSGRFGANDVRHERLHRFRDRAEVERIVYSSGFDQVMVAAETEMEYHADVPDLLRSIKVIGAATSPRNNSVGGLGWRKIITDMSGIYKSRFLNDGAVPATYEVIYVVARLIQ
jgi:malonyl-CoA O-methyltransferase